MQLVAYVAACGVSTVRAQRRFRVPVARILGGGCGLVPRPVLARPRPAANLAKRAPVAVRTRTVASSALPADIVLDMGSGFKRTKLLDNDGLALILSIKGVVGLEDVDTGEVVNDIRMLKPGGKYKIAGLKETGCAVAAAAPRHGLQPVAIMIDKNDGKGPVSLTFRKENSFRSYLSQAGVPYLEAVRLGKVERTREFSELDPSKTYRWPEDPWSSSLGKQVAMLEGGLASLDDVFRMKLARFLSTLLPSEFGELDVRVGVKFVWESKDLDVDVLLLSKDMLHCVLVAAKRRASEGVIAQQERTVKGYDDVFNIQQKGPKIHPIVAAQLWEDGAKDAVLEKGWWAVSEVSGAFVLEKPQPGPA